MAAGTGWGHHAAVAGDHDAWERYAPWEGSYRLPEREAASSSRRRWLLRALFVLWLLAAVWWTVDAVLTQGWSELAEPLVWLLLALAWGVFSARRPAGTRLLPAGLVVREHPFSRRTVRWDDVVRVERPGRFEEHPVAVLTSGERLALVGLPVDVADQMAAVTRPEPAPRTSPPPRQPLPGDDLDGPFRRGRARR